jgi:O-Antigen ligase
MSLAAAAPASTVAGARLSVETLRGALLWLMAFSGAFVFIEPSPYEVVGLIAIFAFVVTGLSLPRPLAPLIILLVFLNIGYALAVVKVIDQPKPVIWVCVSVYLAVTAIFYAGMLGANTERRLDALMRGYVAAAVVASLVGIAAYFRVFGSASDMFLLYERARGTFNDPNVLGAFVILPALLALQRVLVGRPSDMVRGGLVLLVLMAGLLLSFSRGAWGQLALGAIVLTGLTFVTSRSPRERVRIIALSLIGAFVVVVFIAALLSIGAVAKLFEVRASLEQSYDIGHLGRFGRYALGFQVALDEPFGIGPLQFTRLFFPEDPHNTFLNAFMSGGWLVGVLFHAGPHLGDVRSAFSHRGDAVAADLPGGLCRLSRHRRRKRRRRHRPLAPLFPDPRRAVGTDGGILVVQPKFLRRQPAIVGVIGRPLGLARAAPPA